MSQSQELNGGKLLASAPPRHVNGNASAAPVRQRSGAVHGFAKKNDVL